MGQFIVGSEAYEFARFRFRDALSHVTDIYIRATIRLSTSPSPPPPLDACRSISICPPEKPIFPRGSFPFHLLPPVTWIEILLEIRSTDGARKDNCREGGRAPSPLLNPRRTYWNCIVTLSKEIDTLTLFGLPRNGRFIGILVLRVVRGCGSCS